ncbi:Gfo/Idh/MocA family oxidoreductase (plasmid) [Herbiconiux sp. KACC 21604]|uniref:Gfo/Idh/MocA family protein n=1 Tax=unclassified Herbiconiux TaxID=2618217 RepID=UPI001491824E|nr:MULTISPECIES: Gfo/Idh/MocA family oxidoreductase [unclassified Herbiconiux]QJU56332.1 Gfo/Idh/MocA family oxidoreductase [Herbiconiux sp. SALV-R1]WPO88839.1 Gfo/Idh/MocA family oxidoreductase [Herbiconiux sp. KACC 21604]
MTETPVTRVAVIGAAGWAGSRHVYAFHELGADVAALVDPSPRVLDLAERVGARVLASAAELNPTELDLVVVSLPSSIQPEVTADLVRRGFRVLVEKPIGSSAENAAILRDVPGIDEALMVGYTLHQHPGALKLAEWASTATVVSVGVRSAARKLTLDSWRVAPEEGGVAVVNGIHAIEFVSSLFPGEVSVLSSYGSDGLHGASVPDYAAATLHFADGPLFRLESYWNPWNHTSGLNRDDWFLEIDVIAREGRRVWSNWELHAWDRHGSETVEYLPEVDLFLAQAEAALRFARGGKPPVGYSQALRATELADEIVARARITA